MSNKRALHELRKSYPMGVSGKVLQQVIIMANRAFANATRKPRYVGLGIGLIVTSLLSAAYFIGPIRSAIGESITNGMVQMGIDLALIPLGGFITTFIIKMTSKKSMQDILNTVMPSASKTIVPKTHSSGWWGYTGATVLFVLIVEITRHVEAVTPTWYFLK